MDTIKKEALVERAEVPMNHPLLIELDRGPQAAPLYAQIRERLALLIRRGDLAAGTRLPPERELAEMLHVNRTTVVRAYSNLAAAGLVHAHVGRGTIVQAASEPVRSSSPVSFAGRSPATVPAAFPWTTYLREANASDASELGMSAALPSMPF